MAGHRQRVEQAAWLKSLTDILPGLLPVAAGWMVAFAFCIGSWHLLGGNAQPDITRFNLAEEAASTDLAPYLLRPGSAEFAGSVRALLLRADIGFAYLRVRDARGLAIASAGRYESIPLGGLPASWARSIRLFLYRTMSTPHSGPLVYQGRQIGSLEYGLLSTGGWHPWAGALGLLLGLPWLWWMSLRLKSLLQDNWPQSSSAVVRELGAAVTTTAAVRPQQSSPVVQEQAGQLLAVFDHAALMIDRQQRIIYLNVLAERVTGRSAAELQGRPFADVLQFYDEDPAVPVVLPVAQCLAGDADRVRQHLRLRRRSGADLELEVTTAPLRDRGGLITGVLVAMHPPVRRTNTMMPAVPQQAAVAVPRDSAAISMMLLDQVLESVITTDSQDRIQFANGRALESFGYALSDLRGSHISKLLPVPFLKQSQLRVADYMLVQGSDLPQVMARRQDGTQFPASLIVHPVAYREQQGHVITVRRDNVVKQGGRLGPRLRQMLEGSTDEALVVDAETLQIIEANGNARGNLGYDAAQLAQMTLSQLSPQLSPEAMEANLARLRTGQDDQVIWRSELQRANGTTYQAELRLHLFPGETPPVYFVTLQDFGRVLTAAARSFDEDRLEFLANHDALTGLPSRQLFLDRLTQTIEKSAAEQRPFSVLYTGLSGFRAVNDSHGYDIGDLLLKAVANKLSGLLASSDTVARMGGDEFTILLPDVGRGDLHQMVKRIQDVFSRPLRAGQRDIAVNVSIGATCYPQDSASAEQLLLHADAAMRGARSKGPRQWQVFDTRPASARTVLPPTDLANAVLRRLVTEGKLSVDFQPLVDTRAMQTVAAEIFMHWQHPDRGVLRTTEQVQAASKTKGLSDEIVLWVMECACQQYSSWRNMELPILPTILNMSALSIDPARMLARLRELIAQYRLPEEHLVIAYSETDYMRGQQEGHLRALRDLGVRLCLDDLDSMPVDVLRRFDVDLIRLTPRATAGLPASPEAQALSRKVIALAQQVGVRIAAGNIDRTEQMNAITDMGCHIFQGRLLGDMMTTREFARELARVEIGVL